MQQAHLSFHDRLEDTLRSHPHLQQKTLQLASDGGQVVLRGRVNSYYQKQMAQEALLRIEGVDGVENQLEVQWA